MRHELVAGDEDLAVLGQEGGAGVLREEGAAGGPGELEAEGVVLREGRRGRGRGETAAVGMEFFDLEDGVREGGRCMALVREKDR